MSSHTVDVAVIYDINQEVAMKDASCTASKVASRLLSLWRTNFATDGAVRKSYHGRQGSRIELRSSSPKDVFVTCRSATNSISYSFNGLHVSLSGIRLTERGKNVLHIDDPKNYMELIRILYDCQSQELQARQRHPVS